MRDKSLTMEMWLNSWWRGGKVKDYIMLLSVQTYRSERGAFVPP